MIVKGLDGKEYNWKPKGADACDEYKSKLHLGIRNLLKEIYPFDIILEEVSLPGTSKLKGKDLIADFYIPNRLLIVEAHGEQHYKYNSFFYKNKFEFAKAKKRDMDKLQWCELNNIRVVSLSYSDKIDTWRNTIEQR